jgi:hypothetical protein
LTVCPRFHFCGRGDLFETGFSSFKILRLRLLWQYLCTGRQFLFATHVIECNQVFGSHN